LWNKIKEKTNKEIEVTSIEQISEKNKIALVGNNVKYLKSINLNKYDIIDLDAYGFPIEQLDIIFSRKYRGIIIVTAIQTLYGNLPNKMLFKLGYTKSMINKCRTLFCRNGIEKLKNYLYLNGVKEIEGYFVNRKNYFKFKIN